MNRTRSLLVFGASVGLLAAGVALNFLLKRERNILAAERLEEVDGLIEKIEEAKAPASLAKPRKRRATASARNGHSAKPIG